DVDRGTSVYGLRVRHVSVERLGEECPQSGHASLVRPRRRSKDDLAVGDTGQRGGVPSKQMHSARHDRVEHGLHIRLRAADRAEDVTGGRLSSSAAVSSRLLAWSSVNRRTFSMAMTAWSAKVFTSSICFSEKGERRATVKAPIGIPCW